MLFGLFFGDWTILIVIPGFIFAMVAQIMVESSFKKYAKVSAPAGMTGGAVARRMLDCNGMNDVNIEIVKGELSDHYDPRSRVLRLSNDVFYGNNVAAVGVAAHEVGHALQDAKGYVPLRFRIALVPICNAGSRLAMPMFFIGLLLSVFAASGTSSPLGAYLMFVGIVAYALSVFFQLVTLPVEFNASRRALRVLKNSGTMTEKQLVGSRKVLSAAALTYVAALAVGLLSLLRLLLIASSASRRR